MAEQKQDRGSVAGVLAIVVAIGAYVWLQSPSLESSRPPHPSIADKAPEPRKVEARLWEDPLEAVLRNPAKSKDSPPHAIELELKVVTPGDAPPPGRAAPTRESLQSTAILSLQPRDPSAAANAAPAEDERPLRVLFDSLPGRTNANTEITVLAVMLPGAPYAEAAEVRRRTRYAVVSALLTAFLPQDAEKLHYVRYALDGAASGASAESVPLIPYEWFVHRKAPNERRVLVLWLNDGRLGPRPLAALHVLLSALQAGRAGIDDATQKHLRLKVIGPPDSGRLQDMIDELESPLDLPASPSDAMWIAPQSADSCEKPATPGAAARARGHKDARFELIAAHPTSEPVLRTESGERPVGMDAGKARSAVADLFWNRCSVYFTHTVTSDLALTNTLLKELGHRGFANARDRIAVVAEADTPYGRFFPEQLCEQLKPPNEACEAGKLGNGRVVYFSYLRGLDGQSGHDAARTRASRSEEKSVKSASEKPASRDTAERADGNAQQDYLLRLADRIRRANRSPESDERGEIKAIGVVGTDVYDKLLVLRALREQFPRAVFFTTDLDARLLHPAEIRWTRNLIVASSFGFELHPDLQRHIPPFRDNYQTASFLATLVATDDSSARNRDRIDALVMTPRLFEIGRTRAIDLTALDGANGKALRCTTPADCEEVHPTWRRPSYLVPILYTTIALLCAYVLAYYFNVGTRRRLSVLRTWPVALGLALLCATVAGVIHLELSAQVREPWSVTEGVSIWPSVTIRAVALLLAIYFIHRVFRMVRDSERRIAERFALAKPEDIRSDLPARFQWPWPWRKWDEFRITRFGDDCWQQFPRDERTEPLPAGDFWRQFIRCSSERMTWYRSVPLAIAGGAFCVMLFFLLDMPGMPFRGQVSRYTFIAMLFFGVISFLLLTFIVIDVTKLTQRMINYLSSGRTDWSAATRTALRRQVDLDREAESEWLDLKFIAAHTSAISSIIYFPAIILVLFIAARQSALDRFDASLPLTLVLSAAALIAVACAVMVRTAAERARAIAVRRVTDRILTVKRRGQSKTADQLKLLLERIENLREGAFAPYTQQPVLRAFLLPLGGLGGAAVLESLALFGV